MTERQLQRDYYAATAREYDHEHIRDGDEHFVALRFLSGMLESLGAKSILDVGAGTGRAALFLKETNPSVTVRGIEPVEALRAIGHAKGLTATELAPGDGYALPFGDGEIDVVAAFGVLHHVKDPGRVVSEMLRVATKAVFISDANNYGQGSGPTRLAKRALSTVGLWPLAKRIRTRGHGYLISEGDGLFYPYSLFDNYEQIAVNCKTVHTLSTAGKGRNVAWDAPHVALLGILSPDDCAIRDGA